MAIVHYRTQGRGDVVGGGGYWGEIIGERGKHTWHRSCVARIDYFTI